jgi:hypothetical protein
MPKSQVGIGSTYSGGVGSDNSGDSIVKQVPMRVRSFLKRRCSA